jgi:hypothetical protein
LYSIGNKCQNPDNPKRYGRLHVKRFISVTKVVVKGHIAKINLNTPLLLKLAILTIFALGNWVQIRLIIFAFFVVTVILYGPIIAIEA